MSISAGHFVWAADGLGFGKVVAARHDAVEVLFFESVVTSFRRTYPPARVLPLPLPAQVRAYWVTPQLAGDQAG